MYWCIGALSSESASSFGNARTSEDSLPKEILALRTSRHPQVAAECSQNELGFGVCGLLPGESDAPNRQKIAKLSLLACFRSGLMKGRAVQG